MDDEGGVEVAEVAEVAVGAVGAVGVGVVVFPPLVHLEVEVALGNVEGRGEEAAEGGAEAEGEGEAEGEEGQAVVVEGGGEAGDSSTRVQYVSYRTVVLLHINIG